MAEPRRRYSAGGAAHPVRRGPRLAWAAALAVVAAGSVVVQASSCNDPSADAASTSSSSASSGGFNLDGGDDGANFCGNEFHKVVVKTPLLYFVMDASGSMKELAEGNHTRYALLHDAAQDLVASLGPLIRVGAAVFPHGASQDNACVEGKEVLPPTAGDKSGTLAKAFGTATSVTPFGGTPTAATLHALAPKFKNAFEDNAGPEVVLLVTDGGPNCNEALSCDVDSCIPNIDKLCPKQDGNCCEPPIGSGANCIDKGATLAAIHEITSQGAFVYVIGLDVGDAYESTLAQMAIVGGAAQPGDPFYYRVNDLDALAATFGSIAADLISCEIALVDPPSSMGLTNVYLDGTALVQDPVDGWVWDGADKIDLVGAACAKLKTGKVTDVQVVTGCPTETPK
ncbi:MAG: vWA domain-containing protein [Polyangiaceae bacterium]